MKASERQFIEDVGDRLRKVRKDHGFSLMDVQLKSRGEYKAVVVGSYERGDRTPSIARLHSLCEWYRVPITAVLTPPPLEAEIEIEAEQVLSKVLEIVHEHHNDLLECES